MKQLSKGKWLIFAIATLLFALNVNIVMAAPNTIEVNSLETQVMPEYDAPDILIVNAIKFKNNSSQEYTGDLKWRVPKGSLKQIVKDNSQGDNHIQYQTVAGKDYDEFVWKVPKALASGEIREYHLEYYYNNLKGNPDKQFTFDLSQPYPISSAKYFVIQPKTASNFKLPADFGQPLVGNGLNYYQKIYNNIQADQKVSLTVSYTKTDPNPSIQPGQQPGQNQSQGQVGNGNTGTGTTSSSKVVIIFLAGLAVVIVLIITKAMVNKNRYNDDEEDEDDDEEFSAYIPKKQNNRNQRQVRKSQTRTNLYSEDKESRGEVKKGSIKWLDVQKKKLRQQLIDGRITESLYHELLMELEEEAREINKDS